MLNKFFSLLLFFLTCLNYSCVTVPVEENDTYSPSFWGDEEEDSPYFHPERVKKE